LDARHEEQADGKRWDTVVEKPSYSSFLPEDNGIGGLVVLCRTLGGFAADNGSDAGSR
jgi:hypothetical protein